LEPAQKLTRTQIILQNKQNEWEQNVASGEGTAVRPTNEEVYDPNILLEIL